MIFLEIASGLLGDDLFGLCLGDRSCEGLCLHFGGKLSIKIKSSTVCILESMWERNKMDRMLFGKQCSDAKHVAK